jgi:hypothetical protein
MWTLKDSIISGVHENKTNVSHKVDQKRAGWSAGHSYHIFRDQ